jgi:hypothetical protein
LYVHPSECARQLRDHAQTRAISVACWHKADSLKASPDVRF